MRSPADGPLEHGGRLRILMHEKERAPERPQVKGTTQHGGSARRSPEVRETGVRVPLGEGGARGVLMKDVGKDIELERLVGQGVRTIELAELVVRKRQLPQQHRLGGLVERRALREALLGPACPRLRRPRGHRSAEEILRRRTRARGPLLRRPKPTSRHVPERTIRALVHAKRATRPPCGTRGPRFTRSRAPDARSARWPVVGTPPTRIAGSSWTRA